MKLKGINPIEQHVEKIVLAVVGVVFVGVLAVQFLFSPNEVSYNNKNIPPSEVLTSLGSDASKVLSRMTDPDPSLPEVGTPDLVAAYESRLHGTGFGETRLAAGAFGEPFELAISQVESLSGPVTPLRLPVPGEILAVSQWTTVDPFFADSTPSLDAYLPEAQPMDKVSVTIEAKLSGKLIREALQSVDEGRRAIPSHWWTTGDEGMIEVLSVQAERQRKNADGSWSDPERVGSVRWTPDVLEAYNEGAPEGETLDWDSLRTSDLLSIADLAKEDPSLVAQPAFLPSIAGVKWVRPSKVDERQAKLGIEADIDRIEQEIANLETEIQRIQDRQANARSSTGTRPSTPSAGSSILRAPVTKAKKNARANRPDPIEQKIAAKQDQIADRELDLDGLFEKLEELDGGSKQVRRTNRQQASPLRPGGKSGVVILGGSSNTPRSTTPGRRRSALNRKPGVESPGSLLSLDEYSVWIHDFEAESGAEYRYRLRYGVNNPLFKREKSLGAEDPETLALAVDPIVESDWTDWTDSVAVGRTSYFFVTSARDQGQLGQSASSATAEVYRMFYGYYRKHTIALEPGDTVQGEFRLPDDLPLFDVDAVDEEELMAYFDEREAEKNTISLIGTDDEEEPKERDWLSLVAPRYPLAVDAVMLDVSPYPVAGDVALAGGRAAVVYEVLFFDPISGVVARRPDMDREMDEYVRVQQSADLAGSGKILRPDPEYVP